MITTSPGLLANHATPPWSASGGNRDIWRGILGGWVAQVSCHRSSTSLYIIVFLFKKDRLPACEDWNWEKLFYTSSPWRGRRQYTYRVVSPRYLWTPERRIYGHIWTYPQSDIFIYVSLTEISLVHGFPFSWMLTIHASGREPMDIS